MCIRNQLKYQQTRATAGNSLWTSIGVPPFSHPRNHYMLALTVRLPLSSSLLVRALGIGVNYGSTTLAASRLPAAGVVVLCHHSAGVAGTLHFPSLGAIARFASTVASAARGTSASPAAVVVPSAVLIKVGDGGIWNLFKHNEKLDMDRADLLKALKADEMFAHSFKDVNLGACTITVVKNAALPAGVTVPPAALEMGDAVVEMKRTKTVGDMAKEVGVSGAPLFVRVGLPPTVHAGERWRSDAEVHNSA